MTFRELNDFRDDRALVPVLRSKGMPLQDDLLPISGSLRWEDMNATRTFIWEGPDIVYTPPPPPQVETQPEEPDYTSPVGRRAVSFEEE
jgi:hypothetical protein